MLKFKEKEDRGKNIFRLFLLLINLNIASTSWTSRNASIPALAYAPTFSFSISSSSSLLPLIAAPQKRWSRQNLKNGERSPQTRGEDWSPVVGNVTSVVEGASVRRGSGIIEGNGEIRFVPCL